MSTAETAPLRPPEGIETLRLENGLTLVHQELPYSPAAAVVVGYRAGQLYESAGTWGLSHFCEHMMFKSTGRHGPGEYWSLVQRNGGSANAYTTSDMTVYYARVPSAGLREMLELEADRMTGCLMKPSELLAERKVVLEEELMTDRDSPSGALDAALHREVFRAHPYGRPITGTREDILRFTPESAKEFYRRFYGPSGAVLCMVGSAPLEEVEGEARRLFGRLEGGAGTPEPPEPEPPQEAPRRVGITHPSHLARLLIGFRAPPAGHPDGMMMSLLAVHLSAGRSSRFEELLVKPGLVLDVAASGNSRVQSGLFTVSAVVSPGVDPERVSDIVWREIRALAEEGLPEERVAELRSRRISWAAISDSEPSGRARRLAAGHAGYGNPMLFWEATRTIAGTTPEDLRRIASDWLVPEGATTAVLTPAGEGAVFPGEPASGREGEKDLEPPEVLLPSTVDVPDRLLARPETSVSDGAVEHELGNGLRLICRRDASFPVVSLGFSFPMGSCVEPPELAGLSEVTAESMLWGTRGEDSIEFHARLENLGSGIDISALDELAAGFTSVLPRDLGTAVSVMSDLLRGPALRADDVSRVIEETVSSISEWRSRPVGLAMDSFAEASTEPAEAAGVPSEETLRAITARDVSAHHRACCRPSGTVVTAVGDMDPEELLSMIERGLGDWTDPEEPAACACERTNAPESRRLIRPLPGREQAAILLGSKAPPREHPDHHAFLLLNAILGEGLGSRLSRTVRESHGLAYHVSSLYLAMSGRGRLVTLLLTGEEGVERSLGLLSGELESLTEEPVTESELRLEKAGLAGRHAMTGMSYRSLCRALLVQAALDLPEDHDRRTLAGLLEVTPEEMLEAARRWMGDGVRYLSMAGGVRER